MAAPSRLTKQRLETWSVQLTCERTGRVSRAACRAVALAKADALSAFHLDSLPRMPFGASRGCVRQDGSLHIAPTHRGTVSPMLGMATDSFGSVLI